MPGEQSALLVQASGTATQLLKVSGSQVDGGHSMPSAHAGSAQAEPPVTWHS
jgi:hypothetical protein